MKCVCAHGATEYRYRSVGYIQWGRVGDGRTLYGNVVKKNRRAKCGKNGEKGRGRKKRVNDVGPDP